MASETYIAREIFSALWSLGILAALKDSTTITLPFDPQLRRFIDNSKDCWLHLVKRIGDCCGLSPDVILIANDSSPWNSISGVTSEFSYERLNYELLMASKCNSWEECDFDDRTSIEARVTLATKCQLIDLFDTILQGRYCFNKNKPDLIGDLRDVFELAMSFIKSANPWSESSFLENVFHCWKKDRFTLDIEQHQIGEDYLDWLNKSIESISNDFGS